jgi:hypothetical protein
MTISAEFKNLHLQLSDDDIMRLDEWKISKGMRSRSEAIRGMIRIVMEKEGFKPSSYSSLAERDSEYLAPSNQNSNDDIIRKIIREEIRKVLNEKK